MSLSHHVERYVTFKQQLGYKYGTEARLLRAWADYAQACGDLFLCNERSIDWACKAPSPGSVRRRLLTVRGLAVWLHAEDPRHEIPSRTAVGPAKKTRPAPYLLTRSQIEQIMDAALTLRPTGSITPHTYRCLIGLIAVTGLRCSEAVSLRLTDLTADGLIIRETKFGKSRLVVLHDSTRAALSRYLESRKRARGSDDHLFVLATGRPPTSTTLTDTFIKLARKTGLRGGPGEPGTRLHDLRHGFAARSLEAALATDRDRVHRHMLALGTYLGHVSVSSTYWYLEATPLLLRQIADVAESAQQGGPCDD